MEEIRAEKKEMSFVNSTTPYARDPTFHHLATALPVTYCGRLVKALHLSVPQLPFGKHYFTLK